MQKEEMYLGVLPGGCLLTEKSLVKWQSAAKSCCKMWGINVQEGDGF